MVTVFFQDETVNLKDHIIDLNNEIKLNLEKFKLAELKFNENLVNLIRSSYSF
jgi:hypothetical protein